MPILFLCYAQVALLITLYFIALSDILNYSLFVKDEISVLKVCELINESISIKWRLRSQTDCRALSLDQPAKTSFLISCIYRNSDPVWGTKSGSFVLNIKQYPSSSAIGDWAGYIYYFLICLSVSASRELGQRGGRWGSENICI